MQPARSSNVVPLRAADSRAVPDEPYVVTGPRPRSRLFAVFLAVSLGLHAALVALSGSWTIRAEPPVPLPPLQVIVVTERPPAIAPQPAPPAPRRELPAPQKKALVRPAPPRETRTVPDLPAPAPVAVPPASTSVQAQPSVPVVSPSAGQAATRSTQPDSPGLVSLTPPSLNAGYLNNPPPAYPALARRRGQVGLVLLRVKVSAAGKPDVVRISKSAGVDALDQAALEAVRGWTFVPARRGETAVEAWVEVPIQFRLEGR